MKQLKIENLPSTLSTDIVQIMIAMEEAQTLDWFELLDKMSTEQGLQYAKLKGFSQKEKMSIKLSSDPNEIDELANLYRYVNHDRNSWDLTLEDKFRMMQDVLVYSKEVLDKNNISSKDEILYRQQFINKDEKFKFFWETKSPFSQWYKSSFKSGSIINNQKQVNANAQQENIPLDLQEYKSAEQFMMYQKAMLFFDIEVASQIIKTDDVREIKELGRKVNRFDQTIWEYFRTKIVYEGNKAKFMQNEELKKALFATKGTTLVEASPNDIIWGIGLAEDDIRALKREMWQGKNLLGEILTQIRIELMGEY